VRRTFSPDVLAPSLVIGTSGCDQRETGSNCSATRYDCSVTRSSARSEMDESEMAALLLKAQEEERLGQVIRCDDAEEVRDLFADIRAHRV
jgi:hypothetical protein